MVRRGPADQPDETEHDQQQDSDHDGHRGGRLALEDEDQRGQRDRRDPQHVPVA